MKNIAGGWPAALLACAALLILAACSKAPQSSADAQVQAIKDIRPALGLPDLPLEFVQETGMTNSPDGQWPVAEFHDSQGRKYFVHTATGRVVEIDGRALLQAHAPTQPGEVLSGLQARAQSIAAAIFPDFSSRQAELTYEEGQKGDNYFFTWRDMNAPASFNRPFLQLAFRGSGELFAYYNTLSD
ncbi:MAG TPA: hypothetical protein VIU39_05380 [Anaerolineales bacterium]